MGAPLLAIRLRTLGDAVLTTPALRALKRGHPGSRLDVLTEARYAPVFETLPEVDRVWRVERGARATLGALARLRRERFGGVVDFFGNPRSALLTALSGARLRAGYDLRGRRYAYRIRVPRNPPGGGPEYAAASHVRLAEAVGGVADGVDARLRVSSTARDQAGVALARAGVSNPEHAVGLVAGGTWPAKTWPLSHAAGLALGLLASGREVVAIVGPGEERFGKRLSRLAPGIAHLPPLPDVSVLIAVVASLGALVGTDSGPRHVAAAFGIPTFAWFGSADPRHWTAPDARHATWWTDLPCRGCGRTRCPHWSCLPSLSAAAAATQVLAHLERHVRSAPALGPAAGA